MKVDLDKIYTKLNQDQREVLELFSEIAEGIDARLFLVGGPVRDLLLCKGNIDLDLVLDKGLDDFLKLLKERQEISQVERTTFLTAKVRLGGIVIDLAQARKETYKSPGALPEVEPATLEEDAKRRDFSINALYLKIERGKFEELLDFTGGLKDLKRGRIRILHEGSFLDDPTRILRAIRYEVRLGFKMDRMTLRCLKEALRNNAFSTLSVQRLGAEFLRNLKEVRVKPVLMRMASLCGFSFLSPQIKLDRTKICLLTKWDKFKAKDSLQFYWLLPLMILIRDIREEELERVFSALELTRTQRRIISNLRGIDEASLWKDLRRCLSRDLIYDKLKGLDLHQIVYFYLLSKGRVKRNFGIYIFEVSRIELEIDGKDVKALGVEEGPKIRELLEEVMRAKVRGEVGGRDSQINYLRKLVRG